MEIDGEILKIPLSRDPCHLLKYLKDSELRDNEMTTCIIISYHMGSWSLIHLKFEEKMA